MEPAFKSDFKLLKAWEPAKKKEGRIENGNVFHEKKNIFSGRYQCLRWEEEQIEFFLDYTC